MEAFGFQVEPNSEPPGVPGTQPFVKPMNLSFDQPAIDMGINNGVQALSEMPVSQATTESSASKPGPRMDGILIESLGLSIPSIQSSNGKSGGDNLPLTIEKLCDSNNVPVETRVAVAKALLAWHSLAYRDVRSEAFKIHHCKLLNGIVSITVLPDDDTVAGGAVRDYMSTGAQVPGLLLAQTLQNQTREVPEFAEVIFSELVVAIGRIMDAGSALRDRGQLAAPSAASTRVDTLRMLLHCFPAKARDLPQLKQSLALLLRLLLHAKEAPLLRMEACTLLQAVGVDHEEDPSYYSLLWGERVSELLAAIKLGHPELKRILKKNRALFSVRSRKAEQYLPEMIDSLGMDDLADFLQELADSDPSKLLGAVPTLVRELGQASLPMQHRFLIMGVFLAIALVVGAGPLLPVLGAIGAVATVTPPLFIPFFKLLTVVASAGDEPAVQALYMIARVAKSGLVQSEEDKSAVLDAVNIIKDKFSYSNIFSQETLAALEDFAECNRPAYGNICKWNKGKSARKGDRKDFLVNAGRVCKSKPSTGKGIGALFSPRQKYATQSATAAKLGAVSPSPQSQSLNHFHPYSYSSAPKASTGGGSVVSNSNSSTSRNAGAVRPPSPTRTDSNSGRNGGGAALSLPLTPSINAPPVSAMPATSSSTATSAASPRALFPPTADKAGAGAGMVSFSDFVAQQSGKSALGVAGGGVGGSGSTAITDSATVGGQAGADGEHSRGRLHSWSPFGRRSRPTSPSPAQQTQQAQSPAASPVRPTTRGASRQQKQLEEAEAHRKRDEALAEELRQLKLQVARLEGNLT